MPPLGKLTRLVLPGLTFFFICQCSGDTGSHHGKQSMDDSAANITDRVEIGGRKFVLEAYAWRDFMPITPPEGKPMMVTVRLVAADSLAFPMGIRLDSLRLVSQKSVWETKLSPRDDVIRGNTFEQTVRNAPQWEVGDSLTASVRLIAGDTVCWLTKSDIEIQATY